MVPCLARADVPGTEICSIEYISVPDEVEQAIETWVGEEPHCRGKFSLRAIPTNGGYYLLAIRPDGTVHERLVPDLTAAGVLVASWVSDAWEIERPKKKRKKRLSLRVTAVDEPASAPTERPRWIGLGAARVPGKTGGDVGFRLEMDVLSYDGWKLTTMAQKVEEAVQVSGAGSRSVVTTSDWSLGATFSYTLRSGGWELRGGIGLSALGSKLHRGVPVSESDVSYAFQATPSLAFEISATLAHDLGERWGVALTMGATTISQDWVGSDPALWNYGMTATREATQPLWVLGVRRSY